MVGFSDIFKRSLKSSRGRLNASSLMEANQYSCSLSLTPNDIDILRKYSYTENIINNATIHLTNEQDIEWFKRNGKNITNRIIISGEVIVKKRLVPNFNCDIEISNIKTMNLNVLKELKEKCPKIQKIYLRGFGNHDDFSIDEFIQLKEYINDLIKNVDLSQNEVNRFLQAYYNVGQKICYEEHTGVKGTIISNRAACFGYSDILNFALNSIGIQSVRLDGKSKKSNGTYTGHAWNQVNIDGKWYNCDLTWDQEHIKRGKKLNYCLRNDEFFGQEEEHVIDLENSSKHNAKQDFEQSYIEEYFSQKKTEERGI